MTCSTSMTLSLRRAWSDEERRLHCLAALEQHFGYWLPEGWRK